MRSARRLRTALPALLSLAAIGCGLSLSGSGPDFDDGAPGETAGDDSPLVSSSGGFSFDATLGSSGSSGGSSSGSGGDAGRPIADSSRDARDGGSIDATDSGSPCQKLSTCCADIPDTSPLGSSVQSCLLTVRDGGATSCATYLSFYNSFALCP